MFTSFEIGRIAGISGMLGRLLGAFRPHGGAIGWRATFLAGMLGAAGLNAVLFHHEALGHMRGDGTA